MTFMNRRENVGWLKRVLALIALPVAILALTPVSAWPQEKAAERVVWIARSQASGKPSASQTHYDPYFFMPGSQGITVNPEAERSTCVEYIIKLRQAKEWRVAAFKPRGGDAGTKPGLNLARLLVLQEGEVAVLKFSARRKANTKAVVSFGVGGVRVGDKHLDDIETTLTTAEDPVELTADWTEYEIPLLDDDTPIHPKSLISPFRVTVKEEDNSVDKSVAFFVKDIRFEVRKAKK